MPPQQQGLHCPFEGCVRRFRSFSSYEYHINFHKGERPFPCDRCSEAFRNELTLRAHVKKNHHHHHRLKSRMPSGEVGKDSASSAGRVLQTTTQKQLSQMSKLKICSRTLSVRIRPDDVNQVRIFKQLKESLFWKRKMHHVFNVPFKVLNPKNSRHSESINFWYTPKSKPYPGFIPITKLPEHLQAILDINRKDLMKASRGWEAALWSPLEQRSECLKKNQLSKVRSVMKTQRTVCLYPDESTKTKPGPRKCPYCNKSISSAVFQVHIATHKGYGFRMLRCFTCGRRFLDQTKYKRHKRAHQMASSTTTGDLYDGMPVLTPEIPPKA